MKIAWPKYRDLEGDIVKIRVAKESRTLEIGHINSCCPVVWP